MVINEFPIEIKTVIYSILISFNNIKSENAYFWNENVTSIKAQRPAFRFDDGADINTLVHFAPNSQSKPPNQKQLISEYDNAVDIKKFPRASESVLSQYICDKLQIDYLVEIGRTIVHKILVILERHFKEELEADQDLSRTSN